MISRDPKLPVSGLIDFAYCTRNHLMIAKIRHYHIDGILVVFAGVSSSPSLPVLTNGIGRVGASLPPVAISTG